MFYPVYPRLPAPLRLVVGKLAQQAAWRKAVFTNTLRRYKAQIALSKALSKPGPVEIENYRMGETRIAAITDERFSRAYNPMHPSPMLTVVNRGNPHVQQLWFAEEGERYDPDWVVFFWPGPPEKEEAFREKLSPMFGALLLHEIGHVECNQLAVSQPLWVSLLDLFAPNLQKEFLREIEADRWAMECGAHPGQLVQGIHIFLGTKKIPDLPILDTLRRRVAKLRFLEEHWDQYKSSVLED